MEREAEPLLGLHEQRDCRSRLEVFHADPASGWLADRG